MADLEEQLSPEQQFEREELARAYREVFSLASGKRVLFDFLERCAIYQDAYSGENHAATNYTLGRQAVGRAVIGMLDSIDPRIYPQLLFDVADLKAMDKAAADRRGATEDDENEAV